MGDLRGNITARRLQERQDYAAARERQREINAAAEAAGAGGFTDNRQSGEVLIPASRKAGAGPAENKALRGPGENKTANALTGVDFASDAAAEAAIKAGLTAADFSGRKPSGARGFTAADVREIAG